MTWMKNTFDHWADGAQITLDGMALDGDSPGAIVLNNVSTPGGSSALVASTSAALQGARAAVLTLAAASSYLRFDDPTPGARGVLRMPVKFASNPSVNSIIGIIRDGSNNIAGQLAITTAGQIRVSQGSTAITASQYSLSTNHQYWVEFVVTKGTTTSDGRVEMYVYDSDGTTLLNSYDSGTAVNTGTADLKYFTFGTATTASGWTSMVLDSIQCGVKASGLWGPLANPTSPPTIDVDQPAENVIDLRGSTAGDGSVPVYPDPTHVSGPTLTVTGLGTGLWLFSRDATTDAVYAVSVAQGDSQSTSQNVTIPHLPIAGGLATMRYYDGTTVHTV